jgi:hypothetical protein
MAILLEEPRVKPASDEKVFDKLFAIDISIKGNIDSSGILSNDMTGRITFVPYNSNNETDEKGIERMIVPSIMKRIVANPTGKMAIAYQAIIEALIEERLLQKQEADLENQNQGQEE